MSERNHIDLTGLSEGARAEVIDLVARLRAREGEDPAWLATAAEDALAGLVALEADVPRDQLAVPAALQRPRFPVVIVAPMTTTSLPAQPLYPTLPAGAQPLTTGLRRLFGL